MAWADSDEVARQRFGEQRARNSGWDEMQFDCSNPQDQRFKQFGILSRHVEAFEGTVRTLSTPCVLRDMALHKHKAHPTIHFRWNSPRLQFKLPQTYIDGLNERAPSRRNRQKEWKPSVTKAVCLQFGLRLDPKWYADPKVRAHLLGGENARAIDMIELSKLVHGDHVCRTPECINPGHLQLVPQAENSRRASKTVTPANSTRLCSAPGCSLSVSSQFPEGFNLCQPCGGDAPTTSWIGEQFAFSFA